MNIPHQTVHHTLVLKEILHSTRKTLVQYFLIRKYALIILKICLLSCKVKSILFNFQLPLTFIHTTVVYYIYNKCSIKIIHLWVWPCVFIAFTEKAKQLDLCPFYICPAGCKAIHRKSAAIWPKYHVTTWSEVILQQVQKISASKSLHLNCNLFVIKYAWILFKPFCVTETSI